jgi:hypothetical protein
VKARILGAIAFAALLGAAALVRPSRASDPAASPPCVSAVITHREHTEGSDGITRDLSYRERFHRCQDRVWLERIRRPGPPPAAHAGDRHAAPDVHTLGWLITRAPGGAATLALVDTAGRRVIDVDRGSFETLGFAPRFSQAAQLVAHDGDSTSSTKELTRPSNVPGASWFGREEGPRYFRFLWDAKLELALTIERGDSSGTTRDEVRVDRVPAPAAYPWEELGGLPHVDFADFGD